MNETFNGETHNLVIANTRQAITSNSGAIPIGEAFKVTTLPRTGKPSIQELTVTTRKLAVVTFTLTVTPCGAEGLPFPVCRVVKIVTTIGARDIMKTGPKDRNSLVETVTLNKPKLAHLPVKHASANLPRRNEN